ncbi:hypothetical protein [Niallia taxi]|uniref:hypothetical protein n=1 Tax=Niallia taxi TaxID=2499688 RepID=UPI0015F69E18|nr:hypothetical protein [Niallia taxi]
MESVQAEILENWKKELELELRILQDEIKDVEYKKLELKTKKRFIKRTSEEYENNSLKQKFLDTMEYKQIGESIEQKGNELNVLNMQYEERAGFYKTLLNRFETVTG